jgi:nicotinamide-nucleotide amidase
MVALVTDLMLDELAYSLGKKLESAGWIIGTAESCTGGLVARALTERSGSSAWFDRSVVTYSNDAKAALLGVPEAIFATFGAVSEQCASKMALGLLAQLGITRGATDWKPAIAVSVTGIAGPTGEVPGKPVGTVCFGCALRTASGFERVETTTRHFLGDRASVRLQAAIYALEFAAKNFQSRGFEQTTALA